MAIAGTIQLITGTGTITATDSNGQTRELKPGDAVYEGETLKTEGNISISLVNENGDEIASLKGNGELLVEDNSAVAKAGTAEGEAAEMQAALEQGEEIDEEETAVGEEDRFDGEAFGFYAGDQDTGHVGTRSMDAAPAASREQAEGQVDNYNDPIEFLSAQGIEVDETDGLGNDVTGTIRVDYGTPTGYLTLSADGAIWDAESNTLTFSQDGVDVWQMVVNQTTGEYTFTQLAAFDHGFDNNDHNALEEFEITVTATNDDGNTASFDFTAGIRDDGPSLSIMSGEEPGPYDPDGPDGERMSIRMDLDDSSGENDPNVIALSNDESHGFYGSWEGEGFGHADFGTDGRGDIALSMDMDARFWSWDAETQTLTFSQSGNVEGDPTWQVELMERDPGSNETDLMYRMTQLSAVNHPTGGPNQLIFPEDGGEGFYSNDEALSWNVISTITDSDGDTATQDLTVTIEDDGPSIYGRGFVTGPDGSGYVNTLAVEGDETEGLVSQTFSASQVGIDFGADGAGDLDGEGPNGEIALSIDGGIWDPETMTLTFYQDGVSEAEGVVTPNGPATWTITMVNEAAPGETPRYGYEFNQLTAIDHGTPGDGTDNSHDETAFWNVNMTVIDGDGDTASATINVSIDDDGPSISPVGGNTDMNIISQGDNVTIAQGTIVSEGNGTSVDQLSFHHNGGPLTIDMLSERNGLIIDGDGSSSNLDIEIFLYDEFGGFVANNDDHGGGADGSTHNYDSYLDFGNLAEGNYVLRVGSWNLDSSEALADHNNSGGTGDYQVTLTGDVSVMSSSNSPLSIVGDESLEDGEINPLVTQTISADELGIDFGTDGPGDLDGVGPNGEIALSIDGGIWNPADMTLTFYQDGVSEVEGVLTPNGPATWTITMVNEAAEGEAPRYGYEFNQLTAVDHDVAGDGTQGSHNEEASWTVGMTIIDGDGDTASASIQVSIKDDGPSIVAQEAPALGVDETDLAIDSSVSVSSLFDGNYGTDGEGSTTYSLSLKGSDIDSGIDTLDGQNILLQMNASGQIVGVAGGITYFMISINGSNELVFDQLKAVNHPDGTDPDDDLSFDLEDGTITLEALITDGDGDTDSATLDLSSAFEISDDGPSFNSSEISEAGLGGNASGESWSVDFSDFTGDGSASATINGLVFTAYNDAGGQADTSLIHSGNGLGVKSSDGGDGGRFDEVNATDRGSEMIQMNLPENAHEMTVNFSEFYGTATEGEILFIVLKNDAGEEVGRYELTANSNGDYTYTITSEAAFNQVEFTAAPSGYEGINDNSDFAIQSVRVSTSLGADAIGTVTGTVDGDFGTDGAGGYYMWADPDGDGTSEALSFMEVRDDDGTLLYTMSMDSTNGDWTVYQYADDAGFDGDTFNVDLMIFDADGDSVPGSITVPVSQFIVGDNLEDAGESEVAMTAGGDVPGSDSPDSVPGNDTIDGKDAADVLIGDAGGVQQTESGSVQYIVEMDTSGSMDGSKLEDLQGAVKDMILDVYNQVDKTDSGLVDIQLQEFSDAVGQNASITFDKDAGTITVVKPVWVDAEHWWQEGHWETSNISFDFNADNDNDGIPDGLEENGGIFAWIDSLDADGNSTNYESALSGANGLVNSAYGENHVIFISDGLPNDRDGNTSVFDNGSDMAVSDIFGATEDKGWSLFTDETDTGNEVQALANSVDGIRVIGIGMTGSENITDVNGVVDAQGNIVNIHNTGDLMDAMDTTGDALMLGDSGSLSSVLGNLVETDLLPAGNDTIDGNDGNDLIFGDVINTDGVAEDLADQGYDVSSINGLADGSGWEVFETLETELDGWERSDTIQYIQDNHEALAVESGREGGDDVITGGDGDDIIYGQEGNDTIDGGAGDDVIDGGTGIDTLVLMDDSYESLDFSNVSNMERIELADDGEAQTLSLTAQDVFAMSEGGSLEISGGNDGDQVSLDLSDGWTQSGDTYTANVDTGAGFVDVSISVTDVIVVTYDDQGNPVT